VSISICKKKRWRFLKYRGFFDCILRYTSKVRIVAMFIPFKSCKNYKTALHYKMTYNRNTAASLDSTVLNVWTAAVPHFTPETSELFSWRNVRSLRQIFRVHITD
jgi:hypothetical protein